MANQALDSGKITVYSSYPIEQGIFVTPSKMEAESYAGNGKVYSKTVNLQDVAWLDSLQGQYAQVNNSNAKITTSNNVDIQGRTLTRQQQEYFKDSKVRDENGNLKVLYHGTPNEFTKFSYDFIGSNGTALGKGFYLTDNIDVAESYTTRDGKQGKVMKVYANITKPMSLKEKSISKNDFKKFIEAVDKKNDNQFLSDYGDIDYEGYDNVLNTSLDSYNYSDNDVDLIHDILNTASLSWKDGFKLLKDTLGYDGVISDNIYIPVLPEQIKNVDNQNPTSNEDIRYSLNDDNLVPLQDGEVQSQEIRNENRPIAPLPTNTQTTNQNTNMQNNTEVVTPTNNYFCCFNIPKNVQYN